MFNGETNRRVKDDSSGKYKRYHPFIVANLYHYKGKNGRKPQPFTKC